MSGGGRIWRQDCLGKWPEAHGHSCAECVQHDDLQARGATERGDPVDTKTDEQTITELASAAAHTCLQ